MGKPVPSSTVTRRTAAAPTPNGLSPGRRPALRLQRELALDVPARMVWACPTACALARCLLGLSASRAGRADAPCVRERSCRRLVGRRLLTASARPFDQPGGDRRMPSSSAPVRAPGVWDVIVVGAGRAGAAAGVAAEDGCHAAARARRRPPLQDLRRGSRRSLSLRPASWPPLEVFDTAGLFTFHAGRHRERTPRLECSDLCRGLPRGLSAPGGPGQYRNLMPVLTATLHGSRERPSAPS